ncbi:unnamed protein product [Cuscuta campestris]|uniref:PB1 domain-containing protein n=1 Tax=Cuscuta campestris TaxID=132261 RepID=A0A484LQH1_9ASTE|nr:unnamed protein product [Cuscuta campestris]
MDIPPLPTATTAAASAMAAAAAAAAGQPIQLPPAPAATHVNYADSVDSSPRSRNAESWDEPPPYAAGTGGGKLRLMCSYGGRIVPRPHDKSLCYVGGDTRIVVTDRHSSLSDLSLRLSKTLLNGRSFSLKYQLPNEELDSLISVTTDEDLENMIDEYDRINSNSNGGTKTSRLRLFLFPSKSDTISSIESLIESSTKSEDWFFSALNGATSTSTKVLSESSSVNCLLGLDDDVANGNSTGKDADALQDGTNSSKNGGVNQSKGNSQDIHSVPDSPMLGMSSSFDSTSSTTPLGNLPPIRVRVEENQRVGVEEHFSQMAIGVVAGGQKQQEEGGFAALTSPPAPPPPVAAVVAEYPSRIFSDDERSELGVPAGYPKPPHSQPPQQPPPQLQPKPTDLPSPGSVSSEGSVAHPLSRPKNYIYQEPIVHIQPGVRASASPVDPMINDPNCRTQVLQQQQLQDSGYVFPSHMDHHPQMHQHQQYVHAGQFVHHLPSGAMPITSYYPLYPSQQQHHPAMDHPYPVYIVQARPPTQSYNMPVQQTSEPSSAPSSLPQTPPAATVPPTTSEYNNLPPTSKTEISAGSYRAVVAPQMVQLPPHPPQYAAGYSQIHHLPSQSVAAPTSAAPGNYAYAYADPTHPQIYYTQSPFAPQMSAAQYQTIKPAPGIPPETSQLPTENINQHN